jgi:hypothetical protein
LVLLTAALAVIAGCGGSSAAPVGAHSSVSLAQAMLLSVVDPTSGATLARPRGRSCPTLASNPMSAT